MSHQTVTLGLPGDLIFPGSSIDEFTSHIGGHPHCPAGVDPPAEELIKCSVCKDNLLPVLSLYLPRQDTSGTSRSMRIYGCIREGCGKEPGSWRGLRCEWPEIQHTSTSKGTGVIDGPPNAPSKPSDPFALPHSKELSTDAWGLEAPNNSAAFDFGDLSAALDTMHSSSKTAAATTKTAETTLAQPRTASSDTPGTSIENSTSEVPPAVPCLPSFYLVQTQEEAPRAPAMTARERELMERYEEEERMAFGGKQEIKSPPPATPSSSIDPQEVSTAALEGSAAWEGEGYEPDTVLVAGGRATPGRTFLKFLKRLQAAPEQCTRRGGGNIPLWPSDSLLHEPRPCTMCGAGRKFEVQLMAPVIAALEESVEWLISEGVDISLEKVKHPPTSWEWSTVILYTCTARCCPGQWVEDELVVVGED